MLQRNKSSNFSLLPEANIQRSVFDRSSSHKFTFNVGELIPFYVDEVLPGSTHQIRTSKMVRLQTPATPFMDDLYLDTYYFFVPNRLVWDSWKEFQGENNNSHWIPSANLEVPTLSLPTLYSNEEAYTALFPIGSLGDYMGLPAGNAKGTFTAPDISLPFVEIQYENPIPFKFNALPFRCYCQIVNDWFRDQNLSDPLWFPTGNTSYSACYDFSGAPSSQIFHNDEVLKRQALGGRPYQVCKYHDYFTSALPSPLKGAEVHVPIKSLSNSHSALATAVDNTTNQQYYITRDASGALVTTTGGSNLLSFDNYVSYGSAGLSINDLRLAFATQAQYERDARGGTRYTEVLRSNFGVVSPDASLQRSQYLGGNHFRLNVNQVVQQNGGSTDSFLGDVAAFSATADSNGDFIQSFTEHGFIIGVCCARYNHSYQQGAERFWFRKKRFDYYMPAFANIGEQAIKYGEIYADPSATGVDPNSVFGYQEAWADYRMKPNRVSGEMRSKCVNTLDYWHLADNYASAPYLSDAWIREDPNNVDRVLTVAHGVSNQIFADFYIDNKTTQPIPMYSIPATLGGNF